MNNNNTQTYHFGSNFGFGNNFRFSNNVIPTTKQLGIEPGITNNIVSTYIVTASAGAVFNTELRKTIAMSHEVALKFPCSIL
jgi:hypothetical protein